MIRRLFPLLAAVLAACPAPVVPPVATDRHVVVISIDGLRPDAIDKAPAPALQDLIRRGAYCAKAKTIVPSITLPSHASMLTGLDYAHHDVRHNSYRPGHSSASTILAIAKKAGLSTAAFYSKSKFRFIISSDDADVVVGNAPGEDDTLPGTCAERIAEAFAKEWTARKFALAFVHIREPDLAGHAKGWMGEDYLAAVRRADAAVETIVGAVKKAGLAEKTVFILSSDHGGSGTDHHDDIPENRTIPWICCGPGVKAGVVIDRELRTVDTAATALAILGISAPMDGKPVAEAVTR